MEHSTNLNLPYILPSQAQKHVTHNEAIRMLDALVQLAVLDRDLAAPPAEPADGDRHIVAAGASGAWAGRGGQVAAFQDGGWAFLAPRTGWLAWVAAEGLLVVFDGTQWAPVSAAATEAQTFGVNATPDATNRLAVSARGTLLTHEGDDHRLTLNKAAPGDTASLLFQTGYGGRAEIGLTGDDRLHFKVSEDGASFRTALVIDEQTGAASLPATPCGMVNLLINGDFAVNQRGFAGGALSAGAYGPDRWKAGAGGCSFTVSGGIAGHAGGPLVQVIESPGLANRVVTLSVEDLTGGDLAVEIAGETGVITAGAGRRKTTLTLPPGATGHVSVTLEPVSSAVTYRRVQLNEGREALPFERRHVAQELVLCQRYFAAVTGPLMALQKQRELDRARSVNIWFHTRMRAIPLVALSGINLGGHDGINVLNVHPGGFRASSTGAGTDASQPFFTGFTAEAEL